MITGGSVTFLPVFAGFNDKALKQAEAGFKKFGDEVTAIIKRAYANSPRAKKEASKKALQLFRQYSPKAASYLSDHRTTNPTKKGKEKELSLLPALSLIAHENSSHGPPRELDSITETRPG